MNEQDDPEAMVVPIYQLPGGNFQKGQLRDEFAKAAMSALIGIEFDDMGPDTVAHDAYQFADAMLKERER